MIAAHDARAEVKARLSDPVRVAEQLGLAEGAKRQAGGLIVRCPAHSERTPSCSITAPDGTIRVKCFACDFGGDVFNLVAAVRGLSLATAFPEVLREAADLAGVDLARSAPRPVAARPAPPITAPAPASLAAEWEALDDLDGDGWEFLSGRGLAGASTWCKAAPSSGPLAPVAPGIAVAMRDATGRVVAIQARNLRSGEGHDFRVAGSSKAGCFGEPQRVSSAATVVVCEGLTDTLAALQAFQGARSTAVVGIAGVQVAEALHGLPWAGKRALVATDADGPGDAAAKAIADTIDRAGGRAVRLRPEGAKDLAALLAKGVDLLAWARGAFGREMGFHAFGSRVAGEQGRRMADAGKALSYGVPYLDRITGGIVPRDVVLVGAESGMGKTELVTIIAMTAALAGKRVHYFALEPEPDEIERRIKFRYLSSEVARQIRGVHLNYQDWMQGKLDHITGPFEDEADRVLGERYRSLHTFYRHERKGEFTANDFAKMAHALGDESDLNIVDHVHYFDEGEDANRGQKRTAMQMRDLAISTGVPLVEIAHLRKKSNQVRKKPRLIPERDDFEGSSHLFKPVKRAILLAPAFDQRKQVPWVWPTYFSLVKNTFDSSRCRYVGLVGFNARYNTYEESFGVGKLTSQGEKFEYLASDEVPYWANQQSEVLL